ncbi:hypothetical protein JTB14_023848 [Gonioctena quinquepunctata]|nr:hypothetical protein JTB14_023848 [Gonioctena quinquepunctata]
MEETGEENKKPRTGRYVVFKKPGNINMIDWVEDKSDPETEEPSEREESEIYRKSQSMDVCPSPSNLEENYDYDDEYFEYFSSRESDQETESSIDSKTRREADELIRKLIDEQIEAHRKEAKQTLEQKQKMDEESTKEFQKPPLRLNQPIIIKKLDGKTDIIGEVKNTKKEKGKQKLLTLSIEKKEKPMSCLYPEVPFITRPDGQKEGQQAAENSSPEVEKINLPASEDINDRIPITKKRKKNKKKEELPEITEPRQ